MTLDFSFKSAPDARCPMCRSLLTGMSGKHEFRMFPAEKVTDDLFGDGSGIDVTAYPAPAVQDFIATFVPCGCEWHGRNGSALALYVLYIIHGAAGTRFEFGHRQHDNRYAMYVMTHERTETT
jgi:hypothetical protein